MTTYIGAICGHPVTDPRGKRCRSCYLASIRRVCKQCGRVRATGSKEFCRECFFEHKRKNFCQDCGKPVSKAQTLRCMDCWKALRAGQCQVSHCIDCGLEVISSQRNKTWQRCRSCHHHWKRSQPKPICSAENCIRPVFSRGWCRNHYKTFTKQWQRRNRKGLTSLSRKQIQVMPCAVCGWNEDVCDVHKVVPELGYVPGNRIPLCPNCHRLVTNGRIPRPDIRL